MLRCALFVGVTIVYNMTDVHIPFKVYPLRFWARLLSITRVVLQQDKRSSYQRQYNIVSSVQRRTSLYSTHSFTKKKKIYNKKLEQQQQNMPWGRRNSMHEWFHILSLFLSLSIGPIYVVAPQWSFICASQPPPMPGFKQHPMPSPHRTRRIRCTVVCGSFGPPKRARRPTTKAPPDMLVSDHILKITFQLYGTVPPQYITETLKRHRKPTKWAPFWNVPPYTGECVFTLNGLDGVEWHCIAHDIAIVHLPAPPPIADGALAAKWAPVYINAKRCRMATRV